jgi:hypothetical protein
VLVQLLATSFLGVLLGFLFRTPALIAVSLFVALAQMGIELTSGEPVGPALLRVTGSVVTLQAAYVAGLLLAGLRAGPRH